MAFVGSHFAHVRGSNARSFLRRQARRTRRSKARIQNTSRVQSTCHGPCCATLVKAPRIFGAHWLVSLRLSSRFSGGVLGAHRSQPFALRGPSSNRCAPAILERTVTAVTSPARCRGPNRRTGYRERYAEERHRRKAPRMSRTLWTDRLQTNESVTCAAWRDASVRTATTCRGLSAEGATSASRRRAIGAERHQHRKSGKRNPAGSSEIRSLTEAPAGRMPWLAFTHSGGLPRAVRAQRVRRLDGQLDQRRRRSGRRRVTGCPPTRAAGPASSSPLT